MKVKFIKLISVLMLIIFITGFEYSSGLLSSTVYAETLSAQNNYAISIGEYTGKYTAGQGITGLTLRIYQESTGYYYAEFSFFAVPENPGVPAGKYKMSITSYQDNRYSLKGLQWIDRPSGYSYVNLLGTFSENKFSGDVYNESNHKIGVFDLEKVNYEALNKIVGEYSGSYTANQGATGLKIKITSSETSKYIAEFNFYALPENPGVPSGKYLMDVTYSNKDGKYFLKGYQWINQPPSYYFVDLLGTLTGNTFSGDVLNGTGFGTNIGRKTGVFTLNKTSANPSKVPVVIVPGTVGTWPKSYLENIFTWLDNHPLNQSNPVNYTVNSYVKGFLKKGYDNALSETNKLGIDINGDLVKYNPGLLKDCVYTTYVNGNLFFTDPINNTYTALINILKNRYKYEVGKDLFVFGYDTIETDIYDNARNLQSYIMEILSKTKAKKVRIIAHSQGNLVAREYIEDFRGYDSVDTLVMVAPPNKGVTKCYGMYYYGSPKIVNADKNKTFNFQDDALIGLKSTMVYGNANDDTKKKWVQNYAKSVMNMVPYGIESFKAPKQNGNLFLKHLNDRSFYGYKNFINKVKVSVIYGDGISTVSKYEINLLGPQTTSTLIGDGVVTTDSVYLDTKFSYYKYKGITHDGLINSSNNDSFSKILELVVK